MSYNETYSKDYLTKMKGLIDPSFSLLDVGSGLCLNLNQFGCRFIIALEIHRPYLKNRSTKLPHIIPLNADAKDLSKLLMEKTISTVLFNDSIEHFDKNDGLHLLRMAEEIATEKIVVFTPRGFFPQKGFDYFQLQGQNYQDHLSGWEAEEFLKLGYNVTVFKEFHDSSNQSFVQAFGKNHPPVDAILAWKDLKQ